jgi:Bacterial Ig-like domain
VKPTRRFEVLVALAVLSLTTAIVGVIVLGRPRALAVVTSTPRDGATEVAVGSQIAITFSGPVDESSVAGALSVEPRTEGRVSAAGRRVAFTPRAAFHADTDYVLTVGAGVRDRAGQPLRNPVVIRFHTRGQRLIVRTADGSLLRATLAGVTESLAGPGVGEFAVSAVGALAYTLPGEGVLVAEGSRAGSTRRIPLPRKAVKFQASGTTLEVRELNWSPDGVALGFLGATGDGASIPYVIRLDRPTPTPEPVGPPPDLVPHRSSMPGPLRNALAEIVYGRDTFAFTPDGRGVIVRERNWDYVVLGFDGEARGTFGPFLAVGNASPRGDTVAFVDLDSADRASRRQVVAYERAGRLRALSSPDRDSHSPRFAHRTERLVFLAALAGGASPEPQYAVETVDLESGAQRRLTAPRRGESDEAPRWSPDDGWISFRRVEMGASERKLDRGEVWLVPADGGEARRFPVSAVDARWTP